MKFRYFKSYLEEYQKSTRGIKVRIRDSRTVKVDGRVDLEADDLRDRGDFVIHSTIRVNDLRNDSIEPNDHPLSLFLGSSTFVSV